MTTAKKFLEGTLSGIAGRPVELTTRGPHEFTLSCDGQPDVSLRAAAIAVFGGEISDTLEDYNEQADMSLFYFDAPVAV